MLLNKNRNFHSIINSIIEAQCEAKHEVALIINVNFVLNCLGSKSFSSFRSMKDRIVRELKAAGYQHVNYNRNFRTIYAS